MWNVGKGVSGESRRETVVNVNQPVPNANTAAVGNAPNTHHARPASSTCQTGAAVFHANAAVTSATVNAAHSTRGSASMTMCSRHRNLRNSSSA